MRGERCLSAIAMRCDGFSKMGLSDRPAEYRQVRESRLDSARCAGSRDKAKSLVGLTNELFVSHKRGAESSKSTRGIGNKQTIDLSSQVKNELEGKIDG